MEDQKKTINYLLGVILALVIAMGVTIWLNRDAATPEVKANDKTIRELEVKKDSIINWIERDSKILDSIELVKAQIKISHDSIINRIKTLNREETKNITDYLTADELERIRIFSGLAAEPSYYKRR